MWYVDAEGVGGLPTANPFESRYSSRVIWKVSLIRRFLISTRLNSSIRRFIEPPFHSVLNLQTPLLYSGVLHNKLAFCKPGAEPES